VLTAKLSTYLFSVSKFMWKDELKKKNKKVSSEFTTKADLSFEEQGETALQEGKFQTAEEALETLGDKCLSILKAFYHQGKKMSEIATLFGFGSEKSAKNQKYKCLEKAKLKYAELSLVGLD
jgi:RNA polymerase sigma factor (sigma-70 family)